MKRFIQAQARCTRSTYTLLLAATFFFSATSCLFGAVPCAVNPAPPPAFNCISLAVQNATIPPGGMFQFQLILTEPKPIGTSSTRPGTGTSSSGISLYDPIGVTAGVAVASSSGLQITTISPAGTYGSTPNPDYPILTITAPIPTNSVVGTKYTLGMDLGNSFFLDPMGQAYPTELKTGTLTIGGTMAISDVIPGGGFQPAGTRIAIFGMGFTPASQVDFSVTTLAPGDFQFVSSSEMDVILPLGVVMDGNRVRVRNEAGELSTYFSYLRAQVLGQSSHLLVAQSEPLFSRMLYSNVTLNWSRGGTTFTALAVQNPGTTAAEVTVNLLSASNQVLDSVNFPLAAYSKMTRDLLELFPQPPAGAVAVQVTSTQPIQMMGMFGDDSSGNVVPVIASAQ
jgi:hypothetical protein